jgi:hypothetical protein
MRLLRLISIALVFLLVGTIAAQEDLSWINDLLPSGDDINIGKQLLQGTVEVQAGDLALNEGFSAANAWDTVRDRDGFRIIQGERYEMLLRTSGVMYTGLSTSESEDIVMSADTIHLSEELNDGYGLVCRASGEASSQSGYHFYISGDGYFLIAVYENGVPRRLVNWTQTSLIHQGVDAENSMVAVCVSDYLALYINGELAGEVRDSTFSTGRYGMVVFLITPDSEVHIGFDNLRVWEASTDAPRASTNAEVVATDEAGVPVNSDEQRAVTMNLLEEGENDIELGELLLIDNFEDSERWPTAETDTSVLEVRGGLLRAYNEGNNETPAVIMGGGSYTNTVLEVDTSFVEGAENNAFSLVCRGSETDSTRGYFFTISSDGFHSIWSSDGEGYRFVVEWDRSLAIDLEGDNHLTVVCIDDYFAFYVNDTLVNEFYDSLYTQGSVGMMVFSYEGATEVSFDNLLVWGAEVQE